MKACFTLPDRTGLCAELSAALPARAIFDFGGARLSIAATSEKPLANLRRVYRYFAADRAAAPCAHLVLLEEGSGQAGSLARSLGRTASQLDGHVLLADWFSWGLRIDGRALLHYYASKLTRLWAAERWDPDAVTLHAASLCDGEGGGLLLVGEAAAGKTTLTRRLLDDGFRYCSDDTSCISRKDATCLPFPMALISRTEPEAGRSADIALLDEPRWLVERWDAVGAAFRPRAVYFLAREPVPAIPALRPLRQADAALILLRNLVMPLGADADSFVFALANFDLVCRLADSVRCARVDSSDLDLAHRVILDDYGAYLSTRQVA